MTGPPGAADEGGRDVAGISANPAPDKERTAAEAHAGPADGGGASWGHAPGGSDPRAASVTSPAERITAPLRPPWPLAKRLNRNALTVAAALAGVTVLTVLVVTNPSRRASDSAGGAAAAVDRGPPTPARPAFLDQPPRTPPPPVGRETATVEGAPAGARRPPPGVGRDVAAGLPVPPPIAGEMRGGVVADSGRGQDGPGSASAGLAATESGPAAPSARAQAYQAALTSSVLVSGAGPPAAAPGALNDRVPTESSMTPPAQTQRGPHDIRDSVAASVAPSPTMPGGQVPAARLDPIGSAYTVRAGTLIPGLLLTGINSDLPGEVLGQTSRDVFDSRTERVLLVPKGSRLIGSYDNRAVGTGRLIVAWHRLILPDGRSLALPRLAATDERGQAGLHDQVDHHYARIYGAAILTSLITAGVQLSQPQQSALYAVPSSRQVAAGALGQGLGDVSIENARRGLDVLPTVVIRPGQPFNVFLSGDVAFDGPYVAAANSPGSAPRVR